jgi:diguanylate cyclase
LAFWRGNDGKESDNGPLNRADRGLSLVSQSYQNSSNLLQLLFPGLYRSECEVLISLKKHIEASAYELANAAVSSYKATLTSMAEAGARAMPHLGAGLVEKLASLQEKLSAVSAPAEMTAVQTSVDLELANWGDSAAQYTSDKANEIKEIMVAVAATASAVGERDQRYKSQFSGLTTKLRSIGTLEDLSSIRRSLMESATELTTAARKMAEEGEQSISQLRAEVAKYRARLEQSEKREAVDPLTGFASRREIEAQIEGRISWKSPFCCAILDLNGFKQINDVYGHVAGDHSLKQFAAELKSRVRATDVVGRWGGDEFVLIVDSDFEETETRMDRIREWVFGEYTVSNGKDIVQVTLNASIGIAAWDGKESAIELLARADQRMYAEKRTRSIRRTVVA